MSDQVSGHHVHSRSGERYSYDATYRVLGTLVDWRARLHMASGATPAGVDISGSIRLSPGQTHSVAPTLVAHMVVQTIEAQAAATPAPQTTTSNSDQAS